jgi:hypothetical protein
MNCVGILLKMRNHVGVLQTPISSHFNENGDVVLSPWHKPIDMLKYIWYNVVIICYVCVVYCLAQPTTRHFHLSS